MTTPPFNHRWEKRLHHELRNLPELEAPPTLIREVMAAIRARERLQAAVWWKRPATTWSPAGRLALSVAALAAFTALLFLAQLLIPQAASSVEAGWLAKMAGVWTAALALVDAFLVILRGVVSPFLLFIAAGLCVAYLALFGIGGALWRVVAGQSRD